MTTAFVGANRAFLGSARRRSSHGRARWPGTERPRPSSGSTRPSLRPPRCGGRGTSDPRVRGDERGSERRRFHFGALRVHRTCPPILLRTTSTRTTPRASVGEARGAPSQGEAKAGAVMASRSRPGRPGTPPGRRNRDPSPRRAARTTSGRGGRVSGVGRVHHRHRPAYRGGRRHHVHAVHQEQAEEVRRRGPPPPRPPTSKPAGAAAARRGERRVSFPRGGHGRRASALLDRADVPPELRGRRRRALETRLRAFHEEQVRLAAAQRRIRGEAAPARRRGAEGQGTRPRNTPGGRC